MPTEPIAVNVIVCQEVLAETTGVVSAIRIFDTLTISPGNNFAHFYVLTLAVSRTGDFDPHILVVTLNAWNGQEIARAPNQDFKYGYNIDVSGPGGFRLTTEFNIDLRPLAALGQFMVWVSLDGAVVAKAPIMLRR